MKFTIDELFDHIEERMVETMLEEWGLRLSRMSYPRLLRWCGTSKIKLECAQQARGYEPGWIYYQRQHRRRRRPPNHEADEMFGCVDTSAMTIRGGNDDDKED